MLFSFVETRLKQRPAKLWESSGARAAVWHSGWVIRAFAANTGAASGSVQWRHHVVLSHQSTWGFILLLEDRIMACAPNECHCCRKCLRNLCSAAHVFYIFITDKNNSKNYEWQVRLTGNIESIYYFWLIILKSSNALMLFIKMI